MSIIIAGHFQTQDEADAASQALAQAGFSRERLSTFYLSQAGQHDITPIGGDNQLSPGAKETPAGVVQGHLTGGAVGAIVGAATAPVTGPAGPIVGGLVGAHVGSLFSFSKMKEAGEGEEGGRAPVEQRKAGMLVAVAFDEAGDESRAVDVFRRLGAVQIERARGNIANGDWADFDASQPPDIIH
ncbi:glycine zipper domain-containing protein [Massilia sp. Leaf139]|uniref:glycine zipper domain-containing protein n=1 Tax=Massilia sp. Leaf139 TaxID=1736272 RepID=UPI0006F8B087|nr:glycine zipper domain-containing protein [Massilia sp. Leaf139]KQQ89307.1 hypothetical protein ASF77_10040 [Massilia sp. Leaf139]